MTQKIKAEEKIRSLSEDDLQDLIVKLLKEMKSIDVEKNCGPQEFGKDIFFTQEDSISPTNFSCVIKAGDVNQSVANKMIEQIFSSFDIPANTKKGKIQIQKVIAITNGVYKQNSRSLISNSKSLSSKQGLIIFWDINDLVSKCLEFIPSLVTSELSIHLTEYKEKLLEKLSSYDSLRFLQTDFGYSLDHLENLEIKCRTRYNSFKREKDQYLDKPQSEKLIPLSLSEEAELFKTDLNYLISGIPTSGKTSFLKRLGRKFINLFPENYIFFIDLNKSASSLLEVELFDFIANQYFDTVSFKLELNNYIKGKSLLLFDGLDELPDDKIRTEIINKLKDFKKICPKCQIVVSSRNIEFILNNPLIDDNFEKYELLPLNIEEFIKIGEKFLGTGETISEYVTLVKKSDLINAFPKTPLTSILLCILFKEKQINIDELPSNITELYKKFLDLFLNKWDASKGLSQQFKFQQKEFILQSIAKYMHENNLIYIKSDKLKEVLDDLKQTRPIDDLKDTDLFIKELTKSTNVIRKTNNNGDTEFSFFHLTIQEYLASIRLKTTDEVFLIKNLYDDWWLNPTIFYTGKEPDNSSLIHKISDLQNYPLDTQSKIKFIINASMVLTAAHLVNNKERKKLLISMIKIFDELVIEVVKHISLSEDNPYRHKTILDIILDGRNLFYSRFKINSFTDVLKEIWNEALPNTDLYCDITKYCIAYTLSLKTKNELFLLEFVTSANLNVRWFKIVDVDISVNNLNHKKSNDKLIKRIGKKIRENAEYINLQFKQPLKKHISSILEIKPEK